MTVHSLVAAHPSDAPHGHGSAGVRRGTMHSSGVCLPSFCHRVEALFPTSLFNRPLQVHHHQVARPCLASPKRWPGKADEPAI
jgi:hypothetical protein